MLLRRAARPSRACVSCSVQTTRRTLPARGLRLRRAESRRAFTSARARFEKPVALKGVVVALLEAERRHDVEAPNIDMVCRVGGGARGAAGGLAAAGFRLGC